MQTLKIDAEFKALIPAMSVDEYNGLEQSLLTEGCRDALVVWGEILIDGHNRYEICQEHGIVFKTVNVDFKDRTEAKIWIIRNQFGRRNLSDYVRAQLALSLKSFFAEKAKENQIRKPESVPQKSAEQKIETRKELAAIAGVSHDTIAKVERIERQATPELKQAITDKKISINSAVVISEMPEIEQAKIVQLPKTEIIQKVKAHVSHNSGENEWYTPPEYIEAARKVFGGEIDLDPASSDLANQTVKAKVFYTSENSGIADDKKWSGKVWMNPPYAQPLISQFSEKFVYHINSAEIVSGIVLVNNATETKWFGSLVSVCSAVVFPNSRIKFISPNKATAAPLQGQAILYSGSSPDLFLSVFGVFGWGAKIE